MQELTRNGSPIAVDCRLPVDELGHGMPLCGGFANFCGGASISWPLTQAQFDALTSFVYNVGVGKAAKTLEFANADAFDEAVQEMDQFVNVSTKDKNGKVRVMKAAGLVSRRARETAPLREYRIQTPKSLGKNVEYVDLKCDRVSVVGPFLFSEDGSLLFVWYGALLRAAKVDT
jgi:hypothetical protein